MEKGILGARTIKQAQRLMKANVFTCPELIEATYENIEARKHLNAYVSTRAMEETLAEAEASQKRIEKSEWPPRTSNQGICLLQTCPCPDCTASQSQSRITFAPRAYRHLPLPQFLTVSLAA